MGKLRVGIAGLGVGRSHAFTFANLPEHYELAAFCDIEEIRAQMLAEQYGVDTACSRFEDLLAMPELDVIDICTPNGLHYQQILGALAAGKHVICEKPLAGSLAEVDAIARAESASGKRVMPIFQYRFGQGIQKLRYLVDQGVAGRLYTTTVETAWRRREDYYATPWRGKWASEMGGTLVTHAVHQHDLLYFIAGPARSVYARAVKRVHNLEVEDCASLSLEMADGSLATSIVTVGSAEQISRLRFCFSNLSAESPTMPYDNSKEPWTITADSPEAEDVIQAALARFEPQPERFEGQFVRFAQALQSGVLLPVTLADARASVELLTAIYASVHSNQPVELPIGADHAMYHGWAGIMQQAGLGAGSR